MAHDLMIMIYTHHHDKCFLCDPHDETIDHIVVECPYTRHLWTEAAKVLGANIQIQPTRQVPSRSSGQPGGLSGRRPMSKLQTRFSRSELGSYGRSVTLVAFEGRPRSSDHLRS